MFDGKGFLTNMLDAYQDYARRDPQAIPFPDSITGFRVWLEAYPQDSFESVVDDFTGDPEPPEDDV
jgi:hypothetical protein